MAKFTPYFLLAFLLGVGARSFFDVPQNATLLIFGFVFGAAITLLAHYRFAKRSDVAAQRTPQPATSNVIAAPREEATTLEIRIAQNIGQEGRTERDRRESSEFFQQKKTRVLHALCFAAMFLLGMLRFAAFENNIAEDRLHEHYGEKMTLGGVVLSSETKQASERVVLETELGKILIIKRIYPQYKYGDELEATGMVTEPQPYGDFDTKKYLAKDEIYSQMLFPEIFDLSKAQALQDIAQRDGASIAIRQQADMRVLARLGAETKKTLFSIKEKFEENLKQILPEPHASLADGMLLGEEGVLDQNLLDSFRRTGTIHILVLSGYNITIIGIFIIAFLGYFLPQSITWLGGILGIVVFTLMTGAAPAAVRAAIMAGIALLASRSGRVGIPLLALLWAAATMILWNPMLLRFDRGFELSFAATLGLILFSNFFQKKLRWLPKFLGVRESASASLSAQLFVLPLLISWGNAPIVLSPIANVFIVGAVPAVMLFSFLGALAAFFYLPLGQIFAAVSYILITYQIFMAEFFASLF